MPKQSPSAQSRSFAQWLEQGWYQPNQRRFYLLPLSCLFYLISALRRFAYRSGLLASFKAPVPLIVVGNINVGGSGKTPVVVALIDALKKAGYQPAVISRGYGGVSPNYPLAVTESTPPSMCGDEPALIARRCKVPVVVGPDRVAAVKYLLKTFPCDVIISDDGLQHYALRRDIELVVIDAARGLGNGELLPAGPLRELPERLKKVFAVLVNGKFDSSSPSSSTALPDFVRNTAASFELCAEGFVHLQTKACQSRLPTYQKLTAIAGIGNPQRFFSSLKSQGLIFSALPYPDHHAYQAEDLVAINTELILMTEKDAVKCAAFNDPRIWYQPVSAQLPTDFLQAVVARLSEIQSLASDQESLP
jgi:tetraacyldisaccharide 4'-kinase